MSAPTLTVIMSCYNQAEFLFPPDAETFTTTEERV